MTTEPFRCADSAEERNEPLYGTASHVRRWLLLEQPGSWGPDALLESRLPVRQARELRARARSHGIRIVLIRRGVRLAEPKRQCYFAITEPHDHRLTRLELDRFDDLLDVDLAPLAAGNDVDGSVPRTDPLFLVCTHGRHDACCSIRGNQVSRVACSQPGLDAWECSHIGGDRFAANVVAFPDGVYYGRVAPDDVLDLTGSHRNGSVTLQHYRGRCCYPFPVQAAEYFTRRETGITAIDGVSLVDAARTDDGISARFEVAGRQVADVDVRVGDGAETYRLTCNAVRAEPIPHYDLVRIRVRDAGEASDA